jgi:hypothetical protein
MSYVTCTHSWTLASINCVNSVKNIILFFMFIGFSIMVYSIPYVV